MAISAKFEADFSQFTSAVKNAEGSLKSLETGAKTLGPAILASLASTELRRFAGDVTNVAKEFIGAFAEEEAAVKKLTVALQAQGTLTPALLQQYTDLAAEFQKTTVNSDDLILSMTGLMVQIGGVMPKDMKAALTAAANLSAGLGIGLEQATLMVAKAFGQGGEQLGKLKALLGDTIPKGAGMVEVMAALEKKFGGQAAAELETYGGSWKQLNNEMSDAKEKVGELLLTVLTPLMAWFREMPDLMQTTIVGFVAIGTALAPLAISIAALTPIVTALGTAVGGAAGLGAAFAGIVKFLGPAGIIAAGFIAWYQVFQNLDVFVWAAVASWNALKAAFVDAVDGITGAARAVYEGVKTWLVDRFQAIVDWVNQKIQAIISAFQGMYMAVSGGSIVPDMIAGVAAEFKKLDGLMVEPVIQATRLVTNQFAGIATPTLAPAAAMPAGTGGGTTTINLVVDGKVLTSVVNEHNTKTMRQGRQWPA